MPARPTPFAGSLPIAALLVTLALGAPASGAAAAPAVRPWQPPAADSLASWASEARMGFRSNRGDSLGGSNFAPYQRVGFMGRRLLHSLGSKGLDQAPAVATILDSLGLDTEVALDPGTPGFVLLMVRDPFHRAAPSAGFLYWYRDTDLRIQAAEFRGGYRIEMRVWWTSRPERPYEWGVVDGKPGAGNLVRFTLFGLNRDGTSWDILQYEEASPVLGVPGEARFVDINGDGRPELVSWVRAEPDTFVESCATCPAVWTEDVFTERRREGFVLDNSRVMPSPMASFVWFVHALKDGQDEVAARLLVDPSKLAQAKAAGWDRASGRAAWTVEYAEPDEGWPRWFEVRFRGSSGGESRYVVHFESTDGRWRIRDWVTETPAPSRTPAAGGAARPGAPPKPGVPPKPGAAPRGGSGR